MYHFIKTTGGWANLANVARIAWHATVRDKGHYIFYGPNGEALGTTRDDPEASLMPIIPAAPGEICAVIHVCHIGGDRPTDDDVWIEQQPVIAWRLWPGYCAEPILLDDPSSSPVYVRMPDGRWACPGAECHDTLEAAQAQVLRDAQAAWDRAAKAPRAGHDGVFAP